VIRALLKRFKRQPWLSNPSSLVPGQFARVSLADNFVCQSWAMESVARDSK
jgi:hypothetical protein